MTENRSKDRPENRPGEETNGQRAADSGNAISGPSRAAILKRRVRQAERPLGPLQPQQPLANARWIISGLLAVFAFGGLCLYGAVCLLFWQGQWQLVFHPSHKASITPIGFQYEDIRFDATETGLLQLHGWWIPGEPNGQYAGYTILFLRDGSGSLSDSEDQLRVLHVLGINVLAFDYRGFGSSVKLHPSEKSTADDADAAWNYLTGVRSLSPQTVVLCGDRLGATIAAEAASRHPQSPALILQDPQPPTLEILKRDPSLRFLPVRLLFHDRFDPSGTLARLPVPKLFLDTSPRLTRASERAARQPLYFDLAAGPKTSAVLHAHASVYRDPAYAAALNGFLNRYLTPQSRSNIF